MFIGIGQWLPQVPESELLIFTTRLCNSGPGLREVGALGTKFEGAQKTQ